MTYNKKINIYVPTYNSELTIKKSILSILKQSYKNITVTVIDNFSTDNTINILEKIDDKRLRIIRRKKNYGILNNLNYSYNIAKGEYAAVYHSNDQYHKNIIKKQLNVLKKNPEVKITFTNAFILNKDRNYINVLQDKVKSKVKYSFNEIFKKLLKHHNFFVCQSAFFRPDFYKKNIKRWDYRFGMSSDLDLWLRFLIKSKVIFLNEVLVKTTIGKNQASFVEKNKLTRSDFFKVIFFYLKKNKVKLNNEDKNNFNILIQRENVRKIINLWVQKKFHKAKKLSGEISSIDILINNKISKKIILILLIKFMIFFSTIVGKSFIRQILILINNKYIT